jgi:tRNA nucleotidyltransferase/poly(A) polymerase
MLSAERVKQELEKTMEQVARPAGAMALWKRSGALATLIPALSDLDDRTIAALDCLALPEPERKPYRRLTRLAMLFIDLGENDVRAAMTALRFSRSDINRVSGLASAWRAMGARMTAAGASETRVRDAEVRRWIAAIGRLDIAPFMRIASARWAAHRDAGGLSPSARQVRSVYRRMLAAALRDPLEIRDLAIDGDDLRGAGIPPGPVVGKILEALLDAVLEDPGRNTPDWLLQEAKRLHPALL